MPTAETAGSWNWPRMIQRPLKPGSAERSAVEPTPGRSSGAATRPTSPCIRNSRKTAGISRLTDPRGHGVQRPAGGYLALKRAGLPVLPGDGYLLVRRLSALDRVGIVPHGIFPAYCEGLFPDDVVIDCFSLDPEMSSKALAKIHWYPEKKLVPASG